MHEFVDFLLALAASPLAYVVMAALLIVDGFFPVVPGESIVVALAVLAAQGDGPTLWLVIVVAIVATAVGDTIAYVIGRRVGIGRWRWMRRRRVAGGFAWAGRAIRRRPAMIVLTGRFVPVARVAVMMTAGVTGFSAVRFVPLVTLAAGLYTVEHAVVGFAAGSWLSDHPVIAVVVALVVVLGFGLALDAVLRAIAHRRERRLGAGSAAAVAVDRHGRL